MTIAAGGSGDAMETLTHRERQVCDRLCRGQQNKEIGMSLGISRRTVEDHRRALMRKSGAANIVMLVRMVYLITDETPNRFDLAMERMING